MDALRDCRAFSCVPGGALTRPVGLVPGGTLWPSAALLYVDAWLGCVIGCVTEAGHVRPRASHATVVLRVAFGVAFPGAPSDAPADGHREFVRGRMGKRGARLGPEAWTLSPWSYNSPPSTESFTNAFSFFGA